MTQEALLRAIRENPEDDDPRLVYADWLTEHGDPRGEFIHAQVRLARLPPKDPRRKPLQARARELLRAHEEAWRAELPSIPGVEWGPFERGFVRTMRPPDLQALRAAIGSLGYGDYFARVVEVARQHPEVVRPLSSALIESGVDSMTWHDAALSFLPERDWPALAADAVNALAGNPANRSAEGVVEEASLQCPRALHPHLGTIFRKGLLARSDYSTWPWRESGRQHFAFLSGVVNGAGESRDDRLRAWRALVETRDAENVGWALGRAERAHGRKFSGARQRTEWIAYQLAEAGLAWDGDRVRALEPPEVWHVAFPEGYFDVPETPAWQAKVHPTWRDLTGLTGPLAFGGGGDANCAFCGGGLHHLLTLDPPPGGLGVTGLKRLTLATCLSCLGWEQHTLFFTHDQEGGVHPHGEGGRERKPQFPVGPLARAEVRLGRAGRRWYWQSWGASNGRQNLYRAGGPPSWVQSADYPSCPGCCRTMPFLLQLDSHLPMEERGREWLWGSGGMGYGFWCDPCRISAWLWQCT